MDTEIINSIKLLSIDMIYNAQSGHPGACLSCAPILYTLYSKFMNVNVNDEKWISRDRFILSNGHASALLYATLYMAGFSLTIDDLRNFRKIDSRTPGHPELGVTPGVDVSTGALGEGIATGVGIALAQKVLSKKYFFPKRSVMDSDTPLLDFSVYVLCGDGDLMEGISYEACSFAGSHHLNNLIVLYDSNQVSLDGATKNVFDDNISERFKSMGWNYEIVRNGNSVSDIEKAIKHAKSSGKPSLIEVNTVLGNGLPGQGTNSVHGKKITKDDIAILKRSLNINYHDEFVVDEKVKTYFMKQVADRGNKKYEIWSNNYRLFIDKNLSGDSSSLNFLFNRVNDFNLIDMHMQCSFESRELIRDANQKIMIEIAKKIPYFIGGSADLGSTTKTYLPQEETVSFENYNGKNISFGVRENSMGAICNGLALCGFLPFCSTMLTFSDYMRPSIRMSALMKLPVVYIFSHDSVDIGQDGPTHQPVEQIASLRLIPGLRVYRPVDTNELKGCWNVILNDHSHPSVLLLSRYDSIVLPTTSAQMVSKGAYIVRQENGSLDGVIVASGNDVYTAVNLARHFYMSRGVELRIVSMPEISLFMEQPLEFRKSIIPDGVKVFTIEAGSYISWTSIATSREYIFSVDNFGYSGSRSDVLNKCGIDFESIKNKMETLL